VECPMRECENFSDRHREEILAEERKKILKWLSGNTVEAQHEQEQLDAHLQAQQTLADEVDEARAWWRERQVGEK